MGQFQPISCLNAALTATKRIFKYAYLLSNSPDSLNAALTASKRINKMGALVKIILVSMPLSQQPKESQEMAAKRGLILVSQCRSHSNQKNQGFNHQGDNFYLPRLNAALTATKRISEQGISLIDYA